MANDSQQFGMLLAEIRTVSLTFDAASGFGEIITIALCRLESLWQSSIGHLLLFSNRGLWNIQRRSVKQSGVGRSF
jgi:hypothetical protein